MKRTIILRGPGVTRLRSIVGYPTYEKLCKRLSNELMHTLWWEGMSADHRRLAAVRNEINNTMGDLLLDS